MTLVTYYLMGQANWADLLDGLGLAPKGRVKHGSCHQKNTCMMANIGCFAIIKNCCHQEKYLHFVIFVVLCMYLCIYSLTLLIYASCIAKVFAKITISTFPQQGGSGRVRQHKKPALLLTTIRNQGRGVKDYPEDWPTPLKSSRGTLSAIELVIKPSELP